MDNRSKAALSCAGAVLLLIAAVIVAFVMFADSLGDHPIKGWQEVPRTPEPPLTVSISPAPTAHP